MSFIFASFIFLVGCYNISTYKESTNKFGQNDLMRAVYYQDLNKVKSLVNSGVPLHHTDVNGANILHYTAYYGSEEIASFLVKQQTEELQMQRGGIRGNLPVQDALLVQNIQVFQVLMESFPTSILELKDDKGRSLLHLSASLEETDIVKDLLVLGVDPNLQDVSGSTPGHLLLYSLEKQNSSRHYTNADTIARDLFVHGLNPDIPNDKGETFRSITEGANIVTIMTPNIENYSLLDMITFTLDSLINRYDDGYYEEDED